MNKSASSLIEQSVKASLNLLPQKSPKIVLGVSGGPDSMALLYALYKVNAEVLAVHINYELRGKESDLDQELVEGMCFEWGFECCSIKLNADKKDGNFQNWAREERYRIFRELKEINGASCIGTAHHKDDQIETILQKVLRGSGVEAWKGMQIWEGEIFRPLLNFTKESILEYCKQGAIPFRVDASNLESGYARNFIRHDLAEKLNDFFPGWQQNILALSEKGRLIEAAVSHIYEELLVEESLSFSKFSKLEEELKSAVLRKYILHNLTEISLSKGLLIDLMQIEYVQPGVSIPIDNTTSLFRDREYITLKKTSTKPTLDMQITKDEAKKGTELVELFIGINNDLSTGAKLFMDANLIKWPITVRNWESGDSFVPFGMKGSQKVSDHLTNRKIPSSKKEKALILSGVDSTIYAIIFPVKAENGEVGTISDIVKCTDQTSQFFTINQK